MFKETSGEPMVKKYQSSANKTKLFPSCLMSIFYQDKPADIDVSCIVVFGEKDIELKYDQDGDDFWSWKGEEVGEGHYVVNANHFGGRGTLHRIGISKYLEGYWVEGGLKGMWRIELLE